MHFIPKLLCIIFVAGFATVSAQTEATTDSTPVSATTATTGSSNAEAATTAAPPDTPESTTPAPTSSVTDASENSTTGEANSTETSTTTPSPAPTTSAPSTPKGVSVACHDLYDDCVMKHAASLMNEKKYCEALKAAVACIEAGNQTDVNNTQECTTVEQERLDLLDCGPVTLFSNGTVSDQCVARVTEYLSTAAPDLNKLTNAYTFKRYFCDVADNSESFLTTADGGSVCTSDEHDALLKAAECSSARALVGSFFLIAFVFLIQRVLGEN